MVVRKQKITDIPLTISRDIHLQGITLLDAARHYGNYCDDASYRDIETPASIENVIENNKVNHPLVQMVGLISTEIMKKNARQDKFEQDVMPVIQGFVSGKLITYGDNKKNRKPDELPHIIPVDLYHGNWPKYFDWRKSSVSGNGIEMINLRVFEYEELKTHFGESSSATGRPTLKSQSLMFLNELISKQLVDCTTPIAEVARLIIKEYNAAGFPKEEVQTERTIANHIREEFRELSAKK